MLQFRPERTVETRDLIARDVLRSTGAEKSVDFLQFVEQHLRVVRHVFDQVGEAREDVRLNLERLGILDRQLIGGKRRVEKILDGIDVVVHDIAVHERRQLLRDLLEFLRRVAAVDGDHVEAELLVGLTLDQQLEKDIVTERARTLRSSVVSRWKRRAKLTRSTLAHRFVTFDEEMQLLIVVTVGQRTLDREEEKQARQSSHSSSASLTGSNRSSSVSSAMSYFCRSQLYPQALAANKSSTVF